MSARLKSYINDILKPSLRLTSDYEVLDGTPIWIIPVEGRSELSYLLQGSDFSKILEGIYGNTPRVEYYDEAIHIYLPELIDGPISLTEHRSAKYNKHIYLFGEKHYSKEGCKPRKGKKVAQFFKELVQSNPDDQIDLFLESPYLSEDIPLPKMATDDIDQILVTFNNCFSYNKSQCEYPNLRAHYTDMRTATSKTELSILIDRLNKNSDDIRSWEEIVRIFKATDDLLNLIMVESDIRGKLAKQLREADPEVVQKMLAYYRKRILDINKFIREIEEYLGILRRGYVRMGTSNELGMKLIKLQSVVLDLYLLGRVFRSFRGAAPPQNILIYVGDGHAEAMRGFLKELGFDLIQETHSKTTCIDISEFSKFF